MQNKLVLHCVQPSSPEEVIGVNYCKRISKRAWIVFMTVCNLVLRWK